MERIVIENLDQYGLISDIRPDKIPINAASDITNIRFYNNAAQAIYQHRSFITAAAAVDGVSSYNTGRGVFGRQIIYPLSNGDIYIYSTKDGISYQCYTGAIPINWSSNVQKWAWHAAPDIVYLMHQNQEPLYLADPEGRWRPVPVVNNFELLPWTTAPLSTWADESKKATFMRAFENILLAFNTLEGGVRYQTRVRWSEPYLPGDVPRTWDEGDTSSIANFKDIADTEGAIWDALQLKTRIYVYKTDGIWVMSKTNGDEVFRFEPAFENIRALIMDCVCEHKGYHFVLTSDDVIIHNGVEVQSIANNRIKRRLFGQLNNDALSRIQVEPYPHKDEVWITFPAGAETDTALIWNSATNAWSERSLPNIRQIARLRVESDTVRDGYFRKWTEYPIAGSSDNKIYELDTVTDAEGVAPIHKWEKTGISFYDQFTHSFIRRISLTLTARVAVTVSIGHHNNPTATPTWDVQRTFDPATDIEVQCRVGGLYHAIKVESNESAVSGDGPLWELYRLVIEIESSGDRGK